MRKVKEPKPKELPKCVHCGNGVHVKEDGGKIKIPLSITYGQFPDYAKEIMLHNCCLNPFIKTIVSKRKPLSN